MIAALLRLGRLRLLAMAGVAVAVLGLLAVLALRAGDPPMAVLFPELETRDAAAVVAALERQRVPYRLAAGGTQLLAPADQVARLRLVLAREGLPAGGGIGWEIFDRGESLTTTPFQQELNRLRAMEGELARSIRSIAGVRGARVHLVLPRREPFSRERGEAQASVVLAMQGAQRLDRDAVQAVLHLVATAVPGLRPQNVSIVDSRGELLARGGQALAGPAGDQSQEELRRSQELRLSRAVEELLERTLGAGRVRAEATVELDFDRSETREERFDPDNQVARSQQSSTEQNRTAEPAPTTVAGNLPGADPPAGGGNAENRQQETTNYEIGRTTRNVVRDRPVVKRISLAVLVDGVAEPATGGGAPAWRERNAEELQRLTALVRSAVGFDERRGDSVQVVSMRFAELEAGTPEAPGWFGLDLSEAMLSRLIESALFALVALAAILLVGRPVASKLSVALATPPALPAAATAALPGQPAAVPPGVEQPALPNEADMVSLSHVEGQMRASSLQRLTELVGRYPEETLAVMRRWLTPAEGA